MQYNADRIGVMGQLIGPLQISNRYYYSETKSLPL